MSVTVSTFQNFVGGKWVDAAEGGTAEIINPSTGDTIAEVPNGTQADVDRAVDAAKAALPEWLETTPGERAEALLKLADALDANTEELAQLESQNVGKPVPAARDEIPVSSDNVRFFAGAARMLEGRATGEYMRGYTSMVRREPVGIVGQIAPWNYPLMMADLEDRPRARGRQRRRPQAVRADAADDAAHGPARRGDLPGRSPERDHRRRRARRRGNRPPPGRAHGLADRRRGDRQGGRARSRGQPEARPSRARRQGAGRRVRRRRPGRGRRGDQDRRLLELGPGLHRGLARDGRPCRSTTSSSTSSCPPSSRCRSATRRRARTSRWAP